MDVSGLLLQTPKLPHRTYRFQDRKVLSYKKYDTGNEEAPFGAQDCF